MSETSESSSGSGLPRVVVLFRPDCEQETRLARQLEQHLIKKGNSVFLDRNPETSMEWATKIAEEIKAANVVIPFLSEKAVANEMLVFQVETAHDNAQSQKGQPSIIPIRVNWNGDLPELIGGILDPIEHLLWESEKDDQTIADKVVERIQSLKQQQPLKLSVSKGLRLVPRAVRKPNPIRIVPAEHKPSGPLPLESVGGAVPLNSEFYIKRPTDKEFRDAITRYDSIILLKGARQIGKTSLLARGLQLARERGAKVALTDFQKFNADNLADVSNFYLSLAESLADQLDLDVLDRKSVV